MQYPKKVYENRLPRLFSVEGAAFLRVVLILCLLIGGLPALGTGIAIAAPHTDLHVAPSAVEDAQTTTLTPVQDTWIWKNKTNHNFGVCDRMTLDTSQDSLGNGRPLLRFDLSVIPVGSVITSARLKLTKTGGSTATHNIEAHAITAAWAEGLGSCAGVSDRAASWNRRQDGVDWSNSGGDYASTSAATTIVSANGVYTWNLTSLAQSWVYSPAGNYGVLLGTPDLGADLYEFASREHATTASRPQLVVEYRPSANNAVTGQVWDDANRNGTQHFSEPGLSGVTVRLSAHSCAIVDTSPPLSRTTDAFGFFSFIGLTAGSYCVRVDESSLPPAYGTTTNQNPFDLTLSNGPAIVPVNFGYASIYATDRLSVGTFAPCTDYTWLQTLAAAHSAAIVTADTDACVFTLAATPANLAALRAALASHPSVRHDQPDVWGYGTYTPNDPDYSNPSLVYAPQQINAPAAWDSTLGNPALILAVIDTGIDFAHPEFAGRILPGYDFVNKDANPADDNGHGTHVAGIAAAGIHNALGMAGIAGTVKILPVKVLNASNVGWMGDVAAGITYAVDQGARVINLSLAGSAGSLSVRDAIAYAVSKGVVVVAAAGNDNTSANRYPAVYETVVAVGATDYNNARWSLSNFGPNVDVMAPGASVWSTRPGNTYAFMSGTSMATPHAAGVAALILSINPNLTSAEVKQALQDTATDMGDPGYDSMHGYGRINAGAAAASIPAAAAIPPTTSLETELLVDLNNNGLLDPGDTLGYTIVAANSGPTTLTNVVISATVPAYTTYVLGSTQLNAIPVLDGGGSFPLDEGGLNIGSVPANNSSRVSFRVVVGTVPRGVYTIFATATVQSAGGKATIVAERAVAGSLLKANVDKAAARSGESLLYTVTSDYAGADLLQNV
ncbi:MAG: DUF11 domain-containing protein, partial [Chloroflexi bacterium]